MGPEYSSRIFFLDDVDFADRFYAELVPRRMRPDTRPRRTWLHGVLECADAAFQGKLLLWLLDNEEPSEPTGLLRLHGIMLKILAGLSCPF
jgi:hypothetical protein